MLNKLKKINIALLMTIFVWGCTPADGGDHAMNEETITAVIIGSTESPDPILLRIKELAKQGTLENVIVMESYPVRIRVTGPKSVIEQLKAMPRK